MMTQMNRASRPVTRSAGRARVTTIRDILKEMEDDERREKEEDQDRLDHSSESGSSSGVSLRSQQDGKRKLIVRIPSATTTRTDRRTSNHQTETTNEKCDNQDLSLHNPASRSINCAQKGAKSRKPASVSDCVIEPRCGTGQRSMSEGGVGLSSVMKSMSSSHPVNIDGDEQSRHDYSIPDDRQSVLSEVPGSDSGLWAVFTNDIDGIESMKFLPKLLNERGSAPFHSVMDEMKQEMKKKKHRREGFKSAIKMSMMFKSIGEAKSKLRLQEADVSSSESDVTDTEDDVIKPKSFSSMSRGWKMINMRIKEEQMEKKKNQDTGGWNLLSKTINHMTNEEKARQELYDKYLHHPDSWVDGLNTCPKFLDDRKPTNGQDPRRKFRPHTAQVPSSKYARNGHIHGTCAVENSLNKAQEDNIPHKILYRRPNSGFV